MNDPNRAIQAAIYVVNLLYGADSVFVKYTLQENKTEL
jgi:hypothetical protein